MTTHLHQAATPAPALSRGLAVLATLDAKGPLSLETLAGSLRLPKASVFRLLETLRIAGMVRKNPDKTYAPLWRLQPLQSGRTHYRDAVIARMDALCAATACTIEWYEPCAEGMRLVHQVNPDTELRVQARPGFLRNWRVEFEAVTRLAHAFAAEAPAVSGTSMYAAHGVLKPLPAAKVRALLADARATRAAQDTAYNTNGVRRHAVAATGPDGLTGILALAECHRFGAHRPRPSVLLKQLAQTLP
ncbi:MAG: helix-turn-helix domain-containing protein [Verrucomicrobiota bacterium]